ncbi:MAG: glycosyltransferase [Candidatus Eremiobacteraeota bacterium]|nr:glycosyltransferase [Candidatus Eremiobacteraeota bacterium]
MVRRRLCCARRLSRFRHARLGSDPQCPSRRLAARRASLPRKSKRCACAPPCRAISGYLNGTALVHDYLNQRGGAERVFAQIARAFPDAPIYTALYDPSVTGDLFRGRTINVSPLGKLPAVNRYFRALAPLYPAVFEAFDFSGYDTIVSSTTAWAKGVRVPAGAIHVSYVNTVSRFIFAYDEYTRGFALRDLARPIVGQLARWDREAAQRPTRLIANSRNVAARIRAHYGRDAEVLHCPVELDRFTVGAGAGDYFFIASRLLPYKRIEIAIDACDAAGVPLLIAGSGPAEAALQRHARGTTTSLLGFIDDRRLNALLGNARAAIVPGEEDFGLAPLEAAASGTPTIALRAGGALETIREHETGEFFDQPASAALQQAIARFDRSRYDPQALRRHAETFSPAAFTERLRQLVADAPR